MRVCFGGVERPIYQRWLESQGVTNVAVNATHVLKRAKPWDPLEACPSAEMIVAYMDPNDKDIDRFMAWVDARSKDPRILAVVPEWADPTMLERTSIVHTWNGASVPRLIELGRERGYVAVGSKVLSDARVRRRIATAARSNGFEVIGLTGSADDALEAGVTIMVNNVWANCLRYGETHVWDGKSLRRYAADDKQSARTKHRVDIERLGVFWEGVMEDEKEALVALSLRSWMKWEGGACLSDQADSNYVPLATSPYLPDPNPMEVVSRAPAVWREKIAMPVLQRREEVVEDDLGNSRTVIRMETSPDTPRQCNNCFLAAACPAFEPGSMCAYNIPIRIRTKDDQESIVNAIIEMQSQRVVMSRFAEEVEGGAIDPRTGQEMDRLLALMRGRDELLNPRDTLLIQAKTRSREGVISRLFGQGAGDNARKLPDGGYGPEATDRFIAGALDVPSRPE